LLGGGGGEDGVGNGGDDGEDQGAGVTNVNVKF